MSRHWAYVRYPWRAAIDVRDEAPANFYAALIGQALRYGLPASRRFGRAWAFAGRRGAPTGALAGTFRRFRRVKRPDLDEIVEQVQRAWPELQENAPGLPPQPPELSVLALERSAALTLFVFGPLSRPLLVAKLPSRGDPRVAREANALEEAGPARVAPRYLGEVGLTYVQEGIDGVPLRVEPLTPDDAAELVWTAPLASLADGMTRLGKATAKPHAADELRAPMEAGLRSGLLPEQARRRLAAAWHDVDATELSVLRHHDTSAQNCLFDGERLAGVVDWELATSRGAPGFDVWNAALSYMEYGVGLVRWSQDRVVSAFSTSWSGSSFWADARKAARASAAAAGFPEERLDALELVFFGSRIGDRLIRPNVPYPTSAETSARLFEVAARGA